MGITLGFILLIWVLDAVFHSRVGDESFISYFIFFNDEPHEVFILVLIAVVFIASGIIITRNTIRIRRSERFQKKQEEDYRLLAEYSNDVIWKLDMSGKFLYVSPSVEKLRGYTPDEVLRQSMYEVLTPKSQETLKGLINRFYQLIKEHPGKTPSIITELEQSCKDGSTVWTEASVRTVMDSKGMPIYFIGVSRDISERKRKEKELRQSEEYYRLLAETSLDYILVHDMEGKIIFINPSGLEASGFDMDDLLGRNIREIVPSDQHVKVEKLMELRSEGDFSIHTYEIEFINKKGERRPVEASSAPILLNKTPISIMVSARDISERIEAQKRSDEARKKMETLNSELESKVGERTRLLQQAVSELESFSYSVSHDLRAPVRQIDAFSKLLNKSLLNDDKEKSGQFLRSIMDSTKKMKNLIDSLLQLSRTGRTELRRDSFSMNLVVEQVIKDIKMENDNHKIQWKVGELGDVNADIGLISQVWYNLISNSVKFANGKENVSIEIGQTVVEEKDTWYIRDNGVGFDSKYQDKLFGVFQRLHSEDDFEGSGIGLATVKRIIDKHHGKIWAESNPGEGAIFYFYLS
jgi:PAS domain S-box-containing protein